LFLFCYIDSYMFLKRLTILGFKSFADRTDIAFHEGITALLGPNGCGKSNVVDAVKWVLGEHAIKSLRAEKMEDVIFGGTETRKPLNVAEVTLTIANEAGLLPLDLPEIEIKRRLYRSGESEYFINGAIFLKRRPVSRASRNAAPRRSATLPKPRKTSARWKSS